MAGGGNPDGGRNLVACTLVLRSRLGLADVLARSYLRHHPGDDFVVAVIDPPPPDVSDLPYRIIGPQEWAISDTDLMRLATSKPELELCSALVPFLLTQLLSEYSSVVYLSAEMHVLGSFDEVTRIASEQGIVLLPTADGVTPRSDTAPAPRDVFDSGFLAIGQGAKPALDEWCNYTAQPTEVLPTRQRYGASPIDRIAALCPHEVLRDSGMGVAFWNLAERPLAETSSGLTAAGSPLKLVNFSGYDPETPWLLSSHQTDGLPVLLSADPLLRTLCDEYRAQLLAAGYRQGAPEPSSFVGLPDGTALTDEMRRLFAAEWHYAQRADDAGKPPYAQGIDSPPPHPFGDDDAEAFKSWLRSSVVPSERATGLNRLVTWLWRSRIDLQVAFPEPCGASAPAFRQWCRTHGVAGGALPDWCLPTEPLPPTEPVDELGVNIIGYLTAGLGLGQMGRIVHEVVQAAGLPVSSISEEHSLSCETGLIAPSTAGDPRFPISILAVNADYTQLVLTSHPDAGHQRYRIGLWAWELDEFPEHLHAGFAHVDEVWTVSEFCREAIAEHSPVPVRVFPVPVADPGEPARRPAAPSETTTFLYLFDFNSTAARKNPWGLIDAFRLAFPTSTEVKLTIKADNGHRHPADAERLRRMVVDDDRIELIEGYLADTELAELYRSADAYVSLHRSEGFGLTVAEAMAHGLPVIATDYSGTSEFLDDAVGWPVSFRMAEVGPRAAPYPPDGRWADPDLHAAARAMQAVATDPHRAARIGMAARERILHTRSMSSATAWLREQLEAAYDNWRQRSESESAPPPSPTLPIEDAREALRWRPEADEQHRNPLAPALRKLMLRAIDHYDVHSRRVLERLLDGISESITLLHQRLDESAEQQSAQVDELDQRLQAAVAASTAQIERAERAAEGRRGRDSPSG